MRPVSRNRLDAATAILRTTMFGLFGTFRFRTIVSLAHAFLMIGTSTTSERRRLWLASAGFMCVASAALFGRTAADTLFLDRYGAETLAYMYIGTALIVGGFSYTFGNMASRYRLSRVIVVATGALAALAVLVRLLVPLDFRALGVLAFFVGDLLVFVPVLVFWSFATELFHPREAKRLFGYIGAAGTAACIAAGFLVAPIARALSTADVFLVAAGLLGVFAYLSVRLDGHVQRATFAASNPARASVRGMRRSRQTRDLALIVFLATVALTLVDFQFKTGAKALWQGTGLATFFGTFYGLGNAVALLIQLFLVHRIMREGGLLVGLRTLPLALLVTAVVAAITSSFAGVVASKFVVQTLAFTVDVAALQVLYMGVARPSRSHTRAVVDGVLKPAAIAVSGVGALAVSGAVLVVADRFATIPVLSTTAAIATLGWLLMTRRNHANYVEALSNSLKSGRLDLADETAPMLDREASEFLTRTIEQADDPSLEALTHLASSLPELDLRHTYLALLDRPSPAAQKTALSYLADRGNLEVGLKATTLIASPDPEVRRAAVRVAGRHTDNPAAVLTPLFVDSDPYVRAEAAARMVSREHHTEAMSVLDRMLSDSDAQTRLAACAVIDVLQQSDATLRVSALLSDSAAEVRVQALRAVESRPDEVHLDVVVGTLSDPETAGRAEEAILAFGERATPRIAALLTEAADGTTLGFEGASRRLPRLLAALPGGRTALIQILSRSRSQQLRLAVARALRSGGDASLQSTDRIALLDELEREVYEVSLQESLYAGLVEVEGAGLLRLAAQESSRIHRRTALEIIATLAGVSCDLLEEGLGCGETMRRSAVLELIDNALDRKRRPQAMALFEDDATEPREFETVDGGLPAPETGLRSAWHTAGLVELYRVRNFRGRMDWILEQVSHPSPVVREVSLRAVASMGTPAQKASAADEVWDDPYTSVRLLARRLTDQADQGSGAPPGALVA